MTVLQVWSPGIATDTNVDCRYLLRPSHIWGMQFLFSQDPVREITKSLCGDYRYLSFGRKFQIQGEFCPKCPEKKYCMYVAGDKVNCSRSVSLSVTCSQLILPTHRSYFLIQQSWVITFQVISGQRSIFVEHGVTIAYSLRKIVSYVKPNLLGAWVMHCSL